MYVYLSLSLYIYICMLMCVYIYIYMHIYIYISINKQYIYIYILLGMPDKIINMINEIYREPKYTIVDKDTTTDPRIQRAGIRQGCPLSPYLFIMLLMTVIMYDVEKGLTEQELEIVESNKIAQTSKWSTLLRRRHHHNGKNRRGSRDSITQNRN